MTEATGDLICDKITNKFLKQVKQKYLMKEYIFRKKRQEIINMLDNTPNQPSKCRTLNWVDKNDDSSGTYNTNSRIKFKISMLKRS